MPAVRVYVRWLREILRLGLAEASKHRIGRRTRCDVVDGAQDAGAVFDLGADLAAGP